MKNRIIWMIGISMSLLIALPYIILGEDAYIQIHDYLDLTIPHIKSIKDNHLLWDYDGIVPIMCGLKRSLFNFVSPVDFRIILFMLLPSYWAIIANIIFVKLFAFLGMYYLLTRHISKTPSKSLIIAISVAFALIPFYVDYGLSSAGFPLILYAFLNLLKNKNLLISFTIITFYGLNSILALSGVFACLCFFIIIVIVSIKKHHLPRFAIWGLLLLSFIYIVTNFDLFLNFILLSNQYVSHRAEFVNYNSILELLKRMLGIIMSSQYHAGSFIAFPMVLFSIYYLCKNFKYDNSIYYYLVGYASFCLMCFIFTSFKVIPYRIFQTFQFDRLYFLYPTVVFVLFAKSFDYIKLNRSQIVFLFFIICGCTSYYNEEMRWQINRYILNKEVHKPSYKEFYDEELFGQIKNEMKRMSNKDPKVVCLGFFPAVAQYNGIWTLDGSLNNYPLSHKHKFSAILKNEVAKSNNLYNYFEKWGCRCYLFSAELYPLGQKAFLCSKKKVNCQF